MSRTVTVMVNDEALEATLTEEEWTRHSRDETETILRVAEWRRKWDAQGEQQPDAIDALELQAQGEWLGDLITGAGTLLALALGIGIALVLWLRR